MQLGPAGDSLKFVGGQDLRDEIYSWPLTNPCMVDQRTARGEYAEATFFDDVLVNSTGFDALETLLFSEPNTHTYVPHRSSVTTTGSHWVRRVWLKHAPTTPVYSPTRSS